MKQKVAYYILIVFLIIIIKPTAYAQSANAVPGELIVMLHSNEAAQLLVDNLAFINGLKTGVKIKNLVSTSMHMFVLQFDATAIPTEVLLKIIAANPLVKTVQINHVLQLRNTPNDPNYAQQWNMRNTGLDGGTANADINAASAWNIATGGLSADGDTIVVAVIDAGFDLVHQDLNFWKNRHEIPNNNIDDDNNGYTDDYKGWNPATTNDNLPVVNHGTHVCGIVGAKGNNNLGVTGVNWGVQLMAVSTDGGAESEILAAYNYVLEQRKSYNESNGAKGAFVVATNSSFGVDLGQPSNYPLWCAMYDSLGAVGILSIAATTNDNINVDVKGDMPTACTSEWLITVTNTTRTDTKATAGYGSATIDLGAPGSSILSTYPNNKYAFLTGTSMASPHVAGAIGLMYAINCKNFMTAYKNDPAGIALAIKDSLLTNVDRIVALNGITLSGGRLNLFKAVKAIYNQYPDSTCTLVDTVVIPKFAFSLDAIGPNPANTFVNIFYTISNEECATIELRILDILGETLRVFSLPNSNLGKQIATIDVSDMNNGMYFLQLVCNSKFSSAKKVVLN
jgi:serine protease